MNCHSIELQREIVFVVVGHKCSRGLALQLQGTCKLLLLLLLCPNTLRRIPLDLNLKSQRFDGQSPH